MRSLDEEAILTCFFAAAFLHKSNCYGLFSPLSLYFKPLSRIIFSLSFNEIREMCTRFLYHDARTGKWPIRLKLTAWNKCDGAERTQVTLWFLFTYQSVCFIHIYISFLHFFEMYFLRQLLRAKLEYQTKTIDSNFATLLVTESRSPKVQSSPVSSLFTCNGCQKVSGSHSSSHSSMTSEQKKNKGKRWLYQKWTANLTSSRLEETRKESLMRNGKKWFVFKRTQSIHLSIDVTKLWGFLPCTHCWLTRLDLKLPRWDETRMSLN